MEASTKTDFPSQNIVNQRLKSVMKTLRASMDRESSASGDDADDVETCEPHPKCPKVYTDIENQHFLKDKLRTLVGFLSKDNESIEAKPVTEGKQNQAR